MESKEKKQIVFFLVAGITLFLVFVYVDSYFGSKRERNFYDHKITGEISDIGFKGGTVFLNLKNDKKDY